MTDKDKIIKELKEVLDSLDITNEYRLNLIKAIEYLQEEPVSKNFEEALAQEWKGYNDRGAATVDALEDNTQELAFAKGFYHGWHYRKEEPVSEELEKAATNYTTHLDKNWSTVKDGYIAENEKEAFKAGAEWQKQQMIKDAVEYKVIDLHENEDGESIPSIIVDLPKSFDFGDKVKVIIIKED